MKSCIKNDINIIIVAFIRNLSLNILIPKDILMIIHTFYVITDPYLISFVSFALNPIITNIFTKKVSKLFSKRDVYPPIRSFRASTFKYKYKNLPKWIKNDYKFPLYPLNTELIGIIRFGANHEFFSNHEINFDLDLLLFIK